MYMTLNEGIITPITEEIDDLNISPLGGPMDSLRSQPNVERGDGTKVQLCQNLHEIKTGPFPYWACMALGDLDISGDYGVKQPPNCPLIKTRTRECEVIVGK